MFLCYKKKIQFIFVGFETCSHSFVFDLWTFSAKHQHK